MSSHVVVTADDKHVQETVLVQASQNLGNSVASQTVDLSQGGRVRITLAVATTTFTFNNPVDGGEYCIELLQDATGSRLVTWPAAVQWAGGSAPTLTTTASKLDIIYLTYNGVAGKYYDELILKNH